MNQVLLQLIILLFSLVGDKEVNINILFQMALQRLAFMPFGYLVDKYRWDLYSGKVSLDDMNCHWVKLRSEIQGILLKKILWRLKNNNIIFFYQELNLQQSDPKMILMLEPNIMWQPMLDMFDISLLLSINFNFIKHYVKFLSNMIPMILSNHYITVIFMEVKRLEIS